MTNRGKASRRGLYGLMTAILVVAFVATQFEFSSSPLERGDVDELLALARRDDLNVVFILVDTLRADRLGSHDYARDTSPTLDALARTGIRFARHHSQSSWTKTSMAALWTGTYPHRNGILRYADAIPDSVFMPAEIFQEEGYVTAGIWRNGWVAPTFGFEQGFDVYHRPSTGVPIGFQRRESKNPYAKIEGSDLDVTEGVIEFLRLNARDRFFVYAHYMDAHQYMSDEESARFGSSYSDLYDNSIHWTDRNIAAVLAALESEGVRDETIVVITSDHGEAFGEHGREGHAKDLHREVIHIPWIIGLPFELEEGIIVDALTENVDVWPTLLDLMGSPALDHADGRSRLPEILIAAGRPDEIEAPPNETPLFAELDRSWGRADAPSDPIVALTLEDRRYMRVLDPERITAKTKTPTERPLAMLFDTASDPAERRDLLSEEAGDAEVSVLEERLEEILNRPPPPWRDEVGKVELSDMQKGQLRAIGYAIE